MVDSRQLCPQMSHIINSQVMSPISISGGAIYAAEIATLSAAVAEKVEKKLL